MKGSMRDLQASLKGKGLARDFAKTGGEMVKPSKRIRGGRLRISSQAIAGAETLTTGPQEKLPKTEESLPKPTGEFVWRENWFPARIVSSLSKTRPNAITILNEEIVLWWGEDNEWHAAKDVCPHKLAPLSEGRMDNGVLECRYHGWQFNKEGDCQFSPQSAAVPKSCLSMFPAQVHHGMLWVWPQTGADAFLKASQKDPPVVEMFNDAALPTVSPDYTYFKAAANWSLLLENAMDPTHAAALHEGTMGKRKDMVPMKMSVSEVHPTRGVQVKHDGYLNSQQARNLDGERLFIPPCTIRTHYKSDSGIGVDTTIFVTPEKPGSAHVFGKFLFRTPEAPETPKTRLLRKLKLVGIVFYQKFMQIVGIDKDVPLHLYDQNTLNQDALMLHHCDRQMVDPSDKSGLKWRKYKLASQADAGVGAFWTWIEKFGGEPDWAGDVTSAHLSQHKGREFLFDHYERHTKLCHKCMKALDRTQKLIEGTNYGIAGLIALAIIFKDTTSLKFPIVISLGILYFTQKFLQSFKQKFYGLKKLPDEE